MLTHTLNFSRHANMDQTPLDPIKTGERDRRKIKIKKKKASKFLCRKGKAFIFFSVGYVISDQCSFYFLFLFSVVKTL